jgi:hypothetical protein
MKKTQQMNARVMGHTARVTNSKGLGWGLMGGLAGTMVMDIVLMGALSAIGLPAFTCYSIVGNTLMRFFAVLGIEMAGGIPLGVVTHYVVGPLVGALYGSLVARFETLQADNLKMAIVYAVLYVEILSQPILATTPILLKMTTAETLQWFGGSFVMHFLLGVVLGGVIRFGLRSATGANPKKIETNPG